MSEYKQKIKAIDIFGSSYNLTYGSNSHYKSKFGGIFSIISTFMLVSGSILFITRFFDTSSPIIQISSRKSAKPPILPMEKSEIIFGLGVFKEDQILIPAESPKYYTLRITTEVIEINNGVKSVVKNQIPITTCQNLAEKVNPELLKFFKGVETKLLKFAYCFDEVDDVMGFRIKGNKKTGNYSTVKYSVYPCSLPNQADCLLTENLAQAQFVIPKTAYGYLLDKKKEPYTTSISTDTGSLATLIYHKEFELKYKMTEFVDKTSEFSSEKIIERLAELDKVEQHNSPRDPFQVYCTTAQIDDGSCIPLLSFFITSGETIQTIHRQYPSFLQLISGIGGLSDLVMIFFGFICHGYNKYMAMQWLSTKKLRPDDLDGFSPTNDSKKEQVIDQTENLNVVKFFNFSSKISILSEAMFDTSLIRLIPIVLTELEKKSSFSNEKDKTPKLRKSKSTVQLELSHLMKQARNSNIQFEKKLNEYCLKILDVKGKVTTAEPGYLKKPRHKVLSNMKKLDLLKMKIFKKAQGNNFEIKTEKDRLNEKSNTNKKRIS